MLRYLDAPRRDPTATAALRLLSKPRELPRIVALRCYARQGPCVATVAECIAAKGRRRRRC